VSLSIDDVINIRLIELNLQSTDRNGAIDEMVGLLEADGRVNDRSAFTEVVRKREEHGPTGMEMGVAIPHGKSEAVTRAAVAFARSEQGIDFGAEDAPSRLLFMIAAPAGTEDLHVTLLARLARKLIHEDFRDSLLKASTPDEAMTVIRNEVQL
jgi:fructose-specific phosphotransferase system IIA component